MYVNSEDKGAQKCKAVGRLFGDASVSVHVPLFLSIGGVSKASSHGLSTRRAKSTTEEIN